MTEQDAARLAEIREAVARMWNTVSCPSHEFYVLQLEEMAPRAMRDLLRLLDAAARPHDAEFVTRAMYDEALRRIKEIDGGAYYRRTRERAADLAERDRLATALAASEHDRDEWRKTSTLTTETNTMLSERCERLATALAASEARLCVAQQVIAAALDDMQSGDDASAHLILKNAVQP